MKSCYNDSYFNSKLDESQRNGLCAAYTGDTLNAEIQQYSEEGVQNEKRV